MMSMLRHRSKLINHHCQGTERCNFQCKSVPIKANLPYNGMRMGRITEREWAADLKK